MTNIEKIKKMNLSLEEIEKFLKQYNLEIDIDNLSEIEFFNIINIYIETKKNQVNTVLQHIKEEKKDLENKKIKIEKDIKKNQQEKWLEFNQKIEEQEAKLNQEQKKFDQKLKQKELEFKAKLEKEKDDFLQNAKEVFESDMKQKQKKLAQKEQELINKEIQLNEKEEILSEKEKTFEKQKQAQLNNLQEKLTEKEKRFDYSLKEKELNLENEIKQQANQLFKAKEDVLNQKEQILKELDIELQAKDRELNIKEKEISIEKENIPNKINELMGRKIENYEQKIELLEDEIEKLREENQEYYQELNDYKDNQNKELLSELNEKKEELKIIKDKIEKIKEEKNFQIEQNEKLIKDLQDELLELRNENESFRIRIEEIERLNSEIRIKDEKLKEVELLKGENEHIRKKLESIYSTGKEMDLRIKDIQKEENFKDKIKLEQKNEIVDEVEWLENINRLMNEYGVKYPKRLLYAFHTALKSASFSPLTVLAGVSGTGKSELPKLYSYFGGFNFLAEAVQPNWDSPESMMGYYNTIENKFDATNILKFLIQTSLSQNDNKYGYKESMNMILLDEMNLAHIELYFAEFLSKFEQKRGNKDVFIDIKLGAGYIHKILLDSNLLWIGTMNEDETTKSLSDKVHDRSFVINFPRPTKLLSRNNLKRLDEISEFKYLDRKVWDNWIQKENIFVDDKQEILDNFKQITNEINNQLSQTGRAIGHRVWQSMEFYINNHPNVIYNLNNEDELKKATKIAFEEQLVQKIMPKLRGIETHGKEKDVLNSIKELLGDFSIVEDFENGMKNPYGQFIWNSAKYLEN